ncbi:MAG: hypothetical protein GX410_06280 [Elusimicrobia bacterium]|nr:hypothetical protein [Elusimicrobiota bacterium]
MKKLLLAFALLAVPFSAFAEDMTGKFGVGMRNQDFDVRYFASEHFGMHAGTSFSYEKAEPGKDSRDGTFYLGAFYNKEMEDGIFLQGGMLVGYNPGSDADRYYHSWYFNPFVGAEMVYKKRFGLDFKLLPVQYATSTSTSLGSSKYWSSLKGSLGAHYYF